LVSPATIVERNSETLVGRFYSIAADGFSTVAVIGNRRPRDGGPSKVLEATKKFHGVRNNDAAHVSPRPA
jgi:hypothetical protein